MSQSDYDTSQIEVLTAIEAVRRRPAMYVGPLDAADLPIRLLQQATYVFAEGRELESGVCTPTAERDQTLLRFHLDTKILHDNVWFEPTAIRGMARQVESLLPTLSIEVHTT